MELCSSNEINKVGKKRGHQQYWQPPMFMQLRRRLELADYVAIRTGSEEAERVEVHVFGEELDCSITDEHMGPAGMCRLDGGVATL